MFNTLSLFRSLCFVFILLGFNPNISVAATQVSPSGAHATIDAEENINELKSLLGKQEREINLLREGANKRGNSSRLTQSFHFFMFEPIFSPVNALNQPI